MRLPLIQPLPNQLLQLHHRPLNRQHLTPYLSPLLPIQLLQLNPPLHQQHPPTWVVSPIWLHQPHPLPLQMTPMTP